MSNVHKRSLEESPSKHPHQDSGVVSKFLSSVSMDQRVPHEIGQDSRMANTLRVEGRDADRRSPLHSVYRMPLPSNDSQADHQIGTENRIESRHTSRGNTPVEVGKENPTTEEGECLEAHEAVVGNRIDSKTEDRLKDRKRNDVRHRDWGDKEKERSDHRNSTQVNNSNGENKESAKEDKNAEKWERKDTPKNKENSNEREKEHIKRESWNGMEKGVPYNEKELSGGSVKIPECETVLPEQKKHDVDRRKERDANLEEDRPDKRFKFDKQSQDEFADGEGSGVKGSEDHSCNVQQHKRIQRSIASSPLVTNLEARFGPHAQDNEESQGKSEVSYVIYSIGGSMQELIKLRKEYESSQSQVEKKAESFNDGPTLEIRIPAKHVITTNHQVRGAMLWGTDVYTYDSDLVAVLMHTGYCFPTASPPPSAIKELRACIRVLPPLDCMS